jgi:hypothetical protein
MHYLGPGGPPSSTTPNRLFIHAGLRTCVSLLSYVEFKIQIEFIASLRIPRKDILTFMKWPSTTTLGQTYAHIGTR